MYDELEEQMYTRTDEGQLLMTTNNLVKNIRLIQLASSSAEIEIITEMNQQTGEDEEELKVTLIEPSSKIDVLEEVLEEYEGKPVVVSAMSRQLIELAAERLTKHGISHALYTGKTNEFERERNLQEFQAGHVRVLLFTLQAGGVGIDMTAADTMIRLQRSYSMLDNVQGLGRVDRIGAEKHDSLNIVDIIAPGTVEEDQLERIREKEERLESITRDRLALSQAGQSTHAFDSEYALIMSSSVLPPMQGDTDDHG
jgi:SNF2 family DNA or RNA helicase